MRLHKTGHPIANTISDLIGELPYGDYRICYGVLRHSLFHDGNWFEVDKGFWDSAHYDGDYRLSYRGTQPIFDVDGPQDDHGLTLEPWRIRDGYTLILPPTGHVCQFFGIDYAAWLMMALAKSPTSGIIRHKGTSEPIDWDSIARVITFNSTLGIEALRRGIPVISDPNHSTMGSYTASINAIDNYDRESLFRFYKAHQFKLTEKDKICRLIQHYLSTSATIPEKLLPAT